jgi:hypothetical protein
MRRLLWEEMLTVDMNVRYWDEMVRRRTRMEYRVALVMAFLSSGTAATLLFTLGAPWVAKTLSTVSAALSIFISVGGATKPMERMSKIMRAYTGALIQYEDLWAKLEAAEGALDVAEQVKQIRQKLADDTVDASQFKKDDELLRECQAAVKRSRGL